MSAVETVVLRELELDVQNLETETHAAMNGALPATQAGVQSEQGAMEQGGATSIGRAASSTVVRSVALAGVSTRKRQAQCCCPSRRTVGKLSARRRSVTTTRRTWQR